MKKIIIASLVGTVIMFIYQALSWMVLPIHQHSLKHTPQQDSILQLLNTSMSEDGVYYLPNTAPGTSMEDQQKMQESMEGKPWAMIYFHQAHHHSMGMAMALGFLYNLISIIIVCVVLQKALSSLPTYLSRWLVVVSMGILIALQSDIMNWNWWQTPGHYLTGEVLDDILAWVLTGFWLAWYMGRVSKKQSA